MYAGTDTAARYMNIISHGTDDVADEPSIADRTLSDVLCPYRPGSATELVNAAAREVGVGVEEWHWFRVVSLVARLQRESRQREQVDLE